MTGGGGDKSTFVRRAMISGLAAAAVIVIGTFAFTSLNSVSVTPSAQSTPAGALVSGRPSPAATPAPTPDPGAAQPGAAPEPSAKATGPRTSTEVEKGTTTGAALPKVAPPPVLFGGPMPRSAAAVGTLVAGFPAVIPVTPDSKIVDSSVSSSANLLQATLSAKTSLSPQTVTAFYQSEFAKVSLPGAPLPAVGGSTAFDFTSNGNSITLTVSPSGPGGSTYTVLAVLHASS